jgi:hypothetical protein
MEEENKLIIEVDTFSIQKNNLEGNLHSFQEETGRNFDRFLDVVEELATNLGLKIVVETKIKILL